MPYYPNKPSKKQAHQATEMFAEVWGESTPRQQGGEAISATMADDAMIHLHFAYSPAVNAKIKSIPGWVWDAPRKRWLVPVVRLDDLLRIFPHLEVDDEVLECYQNALEARHGVFWDNLRRLGITVDKDGVGHGQGMSPVLQNEIYKRLERR